MFRLPLSLRPEYQLILTCARVHLSAAQQARVQSLALQITNWDEVLSATDVHGVYSLVADNLNSMCADRMPPQVLEKLRSKRALYRAHTLVKLTAIIKVLRILRENEIRTMPLKGAALAGMVYGNSLLRDFTDLDILMQPKDLSRTIAVLDQLGYKPVDEHLMVKAVKHGTTSLGQNVRANGNGKRSYRDRVQTLYAKYPNRARCGCG